DVMEIGRAAVLLDATLLRAIRRAAVAGLLIAVVAVLHAGEREAVAAERHLAGGRAPIGVVGVAVVAGLAVVDDAVAAQAGNGGRRAGRVAGGRAAGRRVAGGRATGRPGARRDVEARVAGRQGARRVAGRRVRSRRR